MKQLFNIIAVALMSFVFTSCEQTMNFKESPIKGAWESKETNISMTLTFGEKDVKYVHYIESYRARATYFGTYTIKDKVITLTFDSIKTKKTTPKIEYTAPKLMPKEAVLRGDTAIVYFDHIFKRIN